MQATRLLQQLQAQQDLDYVERFQALSAINLEIRRAGPNAERLLRKATLEMDVGNHAAALAAARHAAQLAPRDAEPHFLSARALVLMALVRSKAIAGSPGLVDELTDTAGQLVRDASQEFRQALRINPSDQETLEVVALLEALLVANPTEGQVEKALRVQVGLAA